jgi:hypothetical protein
MQRRRRACGIGVGTRARHTRARQQDRGERGHRDVGRWGTRPCCFFQPRISSCLLHDGRSDMTSPPNPPCHDVPPQGHPEDGVSSERINGMVRPARISQAGGNQLAEGKHAVKALCTRDVVASHWQ